MQECNRDRIACVEVVAIVNVVAFPSIYLLYSTYNLCPGMLCEKRQWGNVVRFSSQNGHGRHPLKSSLTERVAELEISNELHIDTSVSVSWPDMIKPKSLLSRKAKFCEL